MNAKFVIAAAAASALLAGCTQVQPGWQGVSIDDWGAPTINGCAKEETQEVTLLDTIRKYPARDVSWDATADQNANPERPPYRVLSNADDQAYMQVPVSLVLDLTTDCEKLKTFHRNLGTKYEAWEGGREGGWTQLLDFVVGQPLEQTLLKVSQGYTYQQIWNDAGVREKYRAAIAAELPNQIKQKAGDDYFKLKTITIGQPYPEDQRLIDARALEQSSQAEATAKQTQATADANARKAAAEAELAAAQAELATQRAEADKRNAMIAGFGEGPAAVEAYLRWIAITEKGITPWPSPIIAGAR